MPQVEIRLSTGDRLAAPGTDHRLARADPVAHHRAGRHHPRGGGRPRPSTWPTCNVELSGFFLDGNLTIGPSMAAVDLIGLALDATAGQTVGVDKTAWTARLTATRCLLGPIRADLSAFPITLTECLIDGTGAALMPCGGDPGGDPARAALAAIDRFPPDLVATGVTFAGAVGADEVWVTDCLFTTDLRTTVTSTGCVRFCHLGPADDPQAHPAGIPLPVRPAATIRLGRASTRPATTPR